MKAAFFAGVSAVLASLASAYTTPVGANPSGNPILTPGLQQQVPIGKPFEITWNPTSSGTVTLVLLRGPSNNVQPLFPIVEKIPNTGSYSWTPPTSLTPDTTHYGIQLIQDSNGVYQYSTQFGLSGDGAVSSSAVSSPVSSAVSSAVSSVVSSAASSTAPSSVAASSAVALSMSSDTGYGAAVPTISAAPVASSSGKVVFLTSVLTVTSCGPEVTHCPARSSAAMATPPVVVPSPLVSAGVVASGVPPAAGYNATVPTVPAVPAPMGSAASSGILAASSGVPPVFGGNGSSPTVPSLPQETGSASSVRVGGFMAAAAFGLTVFLL